MKIHNSKAIQRVGATGILKGRGVPYQWANQTWFDPDSNLSVVEFIEGIKRYESTFFFQSPSEEALTLIGSINIIYQLAKQLKIDQPFFKSADLLKAFIEKNWQNWQLVNTFSEENYITKKELAVILDKTLNPFESKEVDVEGNWALK